jgi:hypothetical protein
MVLDLGTATVTARHEAGHLIAARALGFETGDILLSQTQGGAEIDIYPSLPTISDAIQFIEDRIIILYAGALAQSMRQKECDPEAAIKLLRTTAANDYAKVRELGRTLVGLAHPTCSREDFEKHLNVNDLRLFNEAGTLVLANRDELIDLTQLIARRYAKSNSKDFKLPAVEVEACLSGKTLFGRQK